MPPLLGPRVTVTQKRATRTPDGLGGYTESFGTVETFNAILNPMREDEAQRYNKDTTDTMYNMYIEVSGRTILTQDQIIYGSKTLEVKAVLHPMHINFFYKVILREVR
ncbi:MAG: hypothetical protein OEY10_00425 [Nitrosopumilus sp.]|nr:hypothetical protein [Nitrosopumilus sp.]